VNGQIYSGKSSGLVGSSFFLISCYSLSLLFVDYNLHILDVNIISWYLILYFFGHFVNYILIIFQFTSELYLTNQLYSRNMFMPFKPITAMLIHSMYLLISSSNDINYVTSLSLVLSILKTLNDLFIGFILIFSFFTNCLSISV